MRTDAHKSLLRLVPPLALGLFVALLPANAQPGAAKKPIGTGTSWLDDEAREAARLYFSTEITKCGSSYYGYDVTAGDGEVQPTVYLDRDGELEWRQIPHGAGAAAGPGKVSFQVVRAFAFIEYRGTPLSALRVVPQEVSAAGKLNGVQWQGYVQTTTPLAFRTRKGRAADAPVENIQWEPWSKWRDEHDLGVSLKKERGEWFVGDKVVKDIGPPAIQSCSVKSKFLPFE